MSRCYDNFTPYTSREECLASEPTVGPMALPEASVDTPAGASPWGNAAAQEALASTATRGRDGNFAQPRNGVGAPDTAGFGKKVALTFDDGPNVETTPIVLDVLDRFGIKATFFIHGEKVDSDEARALLARMEASGHIVANHTERHEMLGPKPDRARESIAATHERIAPYQEGDPRYMRFPGGNASTGSVDAAEDQGYAVVGWNVDSADWCYDEPRGGVGVCDPATFQWVADEHRDSLTDNVLAQTKKFDGGILLFHDTRPYTADQIDEIITALLDAGFSFTNLDDPETFPILNGWAASLTPAAPETPSP